MVDECSNKLQRGTCAKNTVRFLKNDPSLTCPQCTVRIKQYTIPIPTEDLSCDNEGHLTARAHDDTGIALPIVTVLPLLIIRTDLERSWAQDDVSQPFSTSQLQFTSSVLSCSRLASTQIDFQLPGHMQLGDDDLRELSYEDGIELIDKMYGADHFDYSIKDMDMSDDEMFYSPAETYYDLEQAHAMFDEIKEIEQNGRKGAIADASVCPLQLYGASPTEVNHTKKTDIEASMFEAREVLERAQQELDKLRHTRLELESDFLWRLERYTVPTQASSRL